MLRSACTIVGGAASLFSMAAATAATGDILVEYQSSLGSKPQEQGWNGEGETECLDKDCPSAGSGLECHFQGAKNGYQNDCAPAIGCNRPGQTNATPSEHYNSLNPSNDGLSGTCTYTEWLVLDDGNDVGYPGGPATRPLTVPDSSWGIHANPAFGAPSFLNAPVGYAPLRLSNGSGAPGAILPHHQGNRSKGSTTQRVGFNVGAGVTAVTAIGKFAVGNREDNNPVVGIRGFGKAISIGTRTVPASENPNERYYLASFRYGDADGANAGDAFAGYTVRGAYASLGKWGPHAGEFFTIRLVLRSDGTWTAWLNEEGDSRTDGTAFDKGSNLLVIHRDTRNSDTMWMDYVQLLEGEVPPLTGGCRSLAFDVRTTAGQPGHDDHVDTQDFIAFQACFTGPAVAEAVFDDLSPECRCMDRNGDAAIDHDDFGYFQRCVTGPSTTADPACDD